MAVETQQTSSIENALVPPPTLYDGEPPAEQTSGATEFDTPITEQHPEDAQPVEGEGERLQPTGEPEERAIGYEDLLPLRQAKEYPDELYQVASRAWGLTPDQLSTPSVRSLLKSKIDSDILIKAQDYEAELADREQQRRPPKPEVETKPPETKPATETAKAPVYSFQDMVTTADQLAERMVTDEGANYVGPLLYNTFANYTAAMDMDPSDPGRAAAITKANRDLTKTFTTIGIMLQAEVGPQITQSIIGNLDERIDSIQNKRAEADEGMNALYADARQMLAREPEYRDVERVMQTPAWQEMIDRHPNIVDMKFEDQNGRPLSDLENTMEQYRLVVDRIRARERRPSEEVVRQAAKTGARQAERQRNRSELGRISTGAIASGRTPGSGMDDEMSDMMGAMQDPLSLEITSNQSRR